MELDSKRAVLERKRPNLANPILAILVLARPILANPFLANLFLDLVCVMARKGGVQTEKNRTPKVGPRRVGPPSVRPRSGAAKGGAEKGGAPKERGGAKFRVFFPLLRSYFRSFCLSLGVFSWNFPVGRIVCREDRALEGASLAPGDKKTLEAFKDPD